MGTHISKVKSISLDSWTQEDIDVNSSAFENEGGGIAEQDVEKWRTKWTSWTDLSFSISYDPLSRHRP
jgi:hypothetical protein